MGLALRKKEERFTYGDYIKWSDEERWELINGMAYDMSPALSRSHQKILGELYRQMATYLLDKQCEVYLAPMDIRLPEGDESDNEIETVVQPDIVLFCDRNKLDDRGARGAPDIVIEILSPNTAKKDCVTKRSLYEKHKVLQYWIVDPQTEEVIIFKLKDNKYSDPVEFKKQDKIQVDIFKDLEIDLELVFKG